MKFTHTPSVSDRELDRLKDSVKNGLSGNKTFNSYTEFVNRIKPADVVRLDVYSDSLTLWEISPAGR